MEQKDIIFLERKISIGMIVSSAYLKRAIDLIEIEWVQSKEAKLIMSWCTEFFRKYKKAPNMEIQDIYMEKLRTTHIQKTHAAMIGEILEDLSEEFEQEKESLNVPYLIDQTVLYVKACKLNGYAEQIQDEVQNGNIIEAEQMLVNYKPPENIESNSVIPLSTVQQCRDAFSNVSDPLLRYGGAFGDMVNHNLTKEAFVAFMGQNKGGKSFILMDAAFRGALQGKNTVFFQAGDMSQQQMERRQGIYLAGKSDLIKYCGDIYVPRMDCVWNQNGECDKKYKEGGRNQEAPLEDMSELKIRNDLNAQELSQAYEDFPDHKPCYNCLRYKDKNTGSFKGSIWYRKRNRVSPLHWKESWHLRTKKYKSVLDRIRVITYPSESLTMSKVNAEWDILERSGFFPEIGIIDYMDLMAADNDTKMMKPRDQENKKWQRGRRLSQEKRVLLLTASQSDAPGFDATFLTKKNFSEDRRKLDHVTSMFGLNMTNTEKVKGIMRVNDIVGRETEGASFVYLFNRLQMGRPVLGSFY